MTSKLSFALALLAAGATQAALAQVAPPPLPPGASMVRPQTGLQEEESKRQVRAHHHKAHNKKDFTADDSRPRANDKAAAREERKEDRQERKDDRQERREARQDRKG